MHKEDLVRVLHALDSNKDGSVSAEEEQMSCNDFRKLCESLREEAGSEESIKEVSHEAELREAFCVFDKDGDGFITPSELQDVLLSLIQREGQDLENCKTTIVRFDKNSDGRIDFMEFESTMKIMKTINKSKF
ncbi:hypothetical protein SUGI_1077290 [Cryptomeria japonica]|nr:hypothetical protein SUGI_1077290 [Cryptomeria japonica]